MATSLQVLQRRHKELAERIRNEGRKQRQLERVQAAKLYEKLGRLTGAWLQADGGPLEPLVELANKASWKQSETTWLRGLAARAVDAEVR